MGENLPPVNLGLGRSAVAITAGDNHNCALLDNGQIKCWGSNGSGQLGLGDTANRGDEPGEMGDSLPAVDLGTGRSAVAITAGYEHTCARLENSQAKCWGNNNNGQLGLGHAANRGDQPGEMGDTLPAIDLGTGRGVLAIKAGRLHTCARLDDGSLKCWGRNDSGQLGLETSTYRGDEPNEMGDILPVVNLGSGRSAVGIALGGDSSCALLDNGQVKCWGINSSGGLGQGDLDNRGDGAGEMGDNLLAVDLGTGRTARAIANNTTGNPCALLDDGTLKCWGYNANGNLGLGDGFQRGDGPSEMGDNLPSVGLGISLGHVATQTALGGSHTCVRFENGQVKCWGGNFRGELGLGDTSARGSSAGSMGDNLPYPDLGTGRSAVQITTGGFHSCARLENGQVKCWGDNGAGQLGLGDASRRGNEPNEMGDNLAVVDLGSGRSVVRVVAGRDHNCARLDDGSLKCWGRNDSGQLGLGDSEYRGDGPGEMGNNLPTVDLGTGRSAVAIAAGSEHTCAVLDDGSVKCWGNNGSGRLGLGDTAARGIGPGEMGNNLPVVNLGTDRSAVAVTAGSEHTCARLDNGQVKCWGRNIRGQLGLGDTANRGEGAGSMGDSLPAVDLGTGRSAVQIAAGGHETCARLENGQAKCWGFNFGGQLGLETATDSGDEPGEMGNFLPAISLGTGRSVIQIDVGGGHTCARVDNGGHKCWGNNGAAQLGVGDVNNRGDEPGEMGDNVSATDLGAN